MREQLRWKLLSEESVRKDSWVDLRARTYLLPNGRQIAPYYAYHGRSFTVIVARDRSGAYVCVRQFRPGIAEVTTEFPAGAIEGGEDALTAAKRELLEETGCVSGKWRFLGKIAANATIADNYAWCYAADCCERVAEQQLDATECVNIAVIPEELMGEMVNGGGFVQAVHIAAYYMEKQKRTAREESGGA